MLCLFLLVPRGARSRKQRGEELKQGTLEELKSSPHPITGLGSLWSGLTWEEDKLSTAWKTGFYVIIFFRSN